MAAIDSSNSSMPNLTNSCFDPTDIDAFINYDNPQAYPSPSSLSPSSSRTGAVMSQQSNKSHASTPVSAPATTSAAANSQQSQLVFPAPSHEYDSYKQQTGLPPGGLANTMAMNRYNENMNFSMGNQNYMMAPNAMFNNGNNSSSSGSSSNGRHQSEEMVDFASPPVQNFSFRNTADMEVDAENPTFFFAPHPAKNQFVDPNVLEGELPRQMPPNQVGRMYPGMHQQQAAMAKAAQQQQQQQEMLRRQQQAQQQQQQQQRQQSANKPQARRDNDPAVEQCISQLLQQMRQSSGTPPEEGGAHGGKSLHVARPKKEEDEMDEDERLLASEEGKKLSSKERRQLRNKVSARAFRSRRKEYIGQLEGEVAAKTNEANDLRAQNRALIEENARLQDLTRMLLSSSHFSSFLNDLSANGGGMSNVNVKALQQQQQQTPTPAQAAAQPTSAAPKDASPANMPQDVQMQNHQMVSMTSTFPADASQAPPQAAAPDMNAAAGWNTGIDMNFQHTPVFAVLEVPQGPSLDAEALAGKSSNFIEASSPVSPGAEENKTEVPTLDWLPVEENEKDDETATNPIPAEEIDESDPCLALFLDQGSTSSRQQPQISEDRHSFHRVESEKPPSIDIVVEPALQSVSEQQQAAEVDTTTVARFERLCARIEGAYQRVKLVTSHLD